MGLRERKKERTRHLIADTAWRLFADRGFDTVTVAEVAREAQVAEATVFNYFPGKEDLFFSRLDVYGTRLVEAVATREPGESALAAFRRHVLGSGGGLLSQVEAGDLQALDRLRTINRVIAASPALRSRERQTFARYADALAAALTAEAGSDDDAVFDARAAANALMAVHRALVEYVRLRVLADDEPDQLRADVTRLGTRAFALLERGLGEYAVRAAPPDHGTSPAPAPHSS